MIKPGLRRKAGAHSLLAKRQTIFRQHIKRGNDPYSESGRRNLIWRKEEQDGIHRPNAMDQIGEGHRRSCFLS
jgi:hypothetical protein